MKNILAIILLITLIIIGLQANNPNPSAELSNQICFEEGLE